MGTGALECVGTGVAVIPPKDQSQRAEHFNPQFPNLCTCLETPRVASEALMPPSYPRDCEFIGLRVAWLLESLKSPRRFDVQIRFILVTTLREGGTISVHIRQRREVLSGRLIF